MSTNNNTDLVTPPVAKLAQPTPPVAQPTQLAQPNPPVAHTNNGQSEEGTNKKSASKAGRTLLVKSTNNSVINSTVFSNFEGLVSKSETKLSNSIFLTFDTIDNAINSYRNLCTDHTIYRVKFSYYRIFFTIEGLDDSTEYANVKKEMCEYIGKQTISSVLYCKFYRKNDKFIGCGDLTLDTFEGMNSLIAKDDDKNEYSFGSFKGKFFRYNTNKKI